MTPPRTLPPEAGGRIAAARRALPETVRALSWVSFANDLASELAYPIVPLFLTVTLGAPVAALGVIEGLAEGVAVGLRAVAGRLSDRRGGRRRPWIASGYGASALARIVIASAPVWGAVLAGRLVDRVGKAVRTAPRDALIRDSTPPALLGASFGYHRALDTAGAVFGPLAAAGLLALGLSLRGALWFAVVPGALTLLLLTRVREAPREQHAGAATAGPLPRAFWVALGVWIVFCAGNSSDAFLLLRAHDLGLSTTLAVLAYAAYNVVYALLSWPLGALSDRRSRTPLLAGGLVVFAAVYVGFALGPPSWGVWPLFAVYGVYTAATDGVARAWIADHAPGRPAGSFYGVFAAGTGAALLLASVLAGLLWSRVGHGSPFWVGAGAGAAAAIALVATR